MEKNKSYTGIDIFRFAAALMIIAIHTSPLESFHELGDFVLTRVTARVAVPFFLMTSGFFLISRYADGAGRLKEFVKRSALLYGIAILVYLPVNLYNGYFKMEYAAANLLKDIAFDGTFYHLWYLPASIMGAAIAWLLVRRFGFRKALAAAGALYIAGLLGDSYYGIAQMLPGMEGFYDLVFQISDQTRNGIFFAPVFLVLGGLAADRSCVLSFGKSICGFGISFMLMLGEALTLHHFQLQRRDSMYVFLLPCMYFLFQMILQFRGKRYGGLRTAALAVYIIHPMMIVVIRLTAKLLHLQKLLVENSAVHYLAVCVLSAAFSMAAAAVWSRLRAKRRKGLPQRERAYLEINRKHLEHNVRVLQKAMPEKCRLMAVVKADAYGHGDFEISTQLDRMGVKAFAVATVDEGIRLRKYGICGEILILGYTDIHRAAQLKKYDLIQTLIDFNYAAALNGQGIAVKAHLKIDTGMHRLGISDEDLPAVKKVFAMKRIQVCGMYTHLSCPESRKEDDIAFTREQIERFYRVADALEGSGIPVPGLHIQSSYGLLNYPELRCDYVRMGIALYGVLSLPGEETVQKLDLRPVLSLKSKVVLIRRVGKGSRIGYDRCFTAGRDSRIAILPVGYGDGIPRSLSCGKGKVWINGHLVPVIGRICMDQLAVDITDAGAVAVGDTATLIGAEESGGLTAPFIAERAGSISNELLCRMGSRLSAVQTGK